MTALIDALRRVWKPSSAEAQFAQLPVYQVAFWPDGWEIHGDGRVTLSDTHMIAEARRWYRLAARNRADEEASRIMALHGVDVPRAIVDMAGRCFPSESALCVAVQLVAGEWARRRRRRLQAGPEEALRERAMAWRGSRHVSGLDSREVLSILTDLVHRCTEERLIPDTSYRAWVSVEDGYGIPVHRCRIQVCLDRYACLGVEDVLRAGLVSWNRAVGRDGEAVPLISVEVAPGSTGTPARKGTTLV